MHLVIVGEFSGSKVLQSVRVLTREESAIFVRRLSETPKFLPRVVVDIGNLFMVWFKIKHYVLLPHLTTK